MSCLNTAQSLRPTRGPCLNAPDPATSPILKLKIKRGEMADPREGAASTVSPLGHSVLTNTLEGVFGFEGHRNMNEQTSNIDFGSMVRTPDYLLHKQNKRKVLKNGEFEDKTNVSPDPQLLHLHQQLQTKVYCRFKTLLSVFRLVDLDKSGKIGRDEFQEFFDQLNLSKQDADLFFDSIGPDENDEISYREFAKAFSAIIYPGNADGHGQGSDEAPDGSLVYAPGWLRKLG